MMDLLRLLGAALLFPGLITAIALGMLYHLLTTGRSIPVIAGGIGSALRAREGILFLTSIIVAGVSLALLPWPFHLAGAIRAWIWAWAGFELAFLLPLLPGLISTAAPLARAAIRQAQVGAIGRALLWMALAAALSIYGDWRLGTLPAHLLALLAAGMAFPIAVGWGPFSDERSITPEGTQLGLPPGLRALDDLAHAVRSGALLGAALLATLPIVPGLEWLGVPILLIGFVVAGLGLRTLEGRLPHLNLPGILRLCWTRVGPLAIAAAAALVIAYR